MCIRDRNNNDLLACYQIIRDNEHFLVDETVSDRQKNNFIYIRGYTQMALGDLASAQKTYYSILEKGRTIKDTSLIVNGLYSLGLLFSDEEEYESAIEHFLQLIEIFKVNRSRPSNRSLVNYELGEAYFKSGQLDKALEIICLLYTSPSPRDRTRSRMPSSA